jgi:hypothetical protein
MSYSRRQLYALGETFGESATRREVGGKIIYGGGGDGGQPEKQTTVVDIPDWAKPYAKESLGKAAALTDTPYQAYGGERIAQFTPLQQQSFERAGQQQVAGQVGFGTGLAGLAGTSSFSDPNAAASFMSPYMDAVVQQQMESAQRQADIASTQRGAQAVKAGAFGGSRQAIENAEAARALASQKGQIQATGLQSAFERAQQQFNQEQATRLNAAQALGQLGQQQFGQQMDITGQQQQLGGVQRQATQDILSQQYQDFLNQQRAPYDQLSFMSSLIRGTPMGQTTTMYQPAPSATSQLVGLGTAAAGLYGASKAAGGEVKSYAAGGIASLLDDVDSLSDEQLAQMQKTPQGPLTLAAVAETLLDRQKMQEGAAQQQALMTPQPETTVAEEALAGLPGLPAPNLEGMDEATMAGGGIVAFNAGGSSQFMQDVAEIPSRFDTYKAGIRAEDERKRLAEAESKRIRDELMEARRKQSFFNYMFGTPETAAEGRAEYKAISEQAAARQAAAPRALGQRITPEVAAAKAAAPVAAQTPAAAAMQGGGSGRRAGLEDPRLQASTVSAMTKALEKPAAPTTKEKVDRETTAGPGGLPQLKGMQAATTEGLAGLKAQVEGINKSRTDAANAAVERAKAQEAELGEFGTEQAKRLKAQEEGLKGAEDKNFNMALIEAGLAMMSGTSANAFENIGKGALVGTKAYTAGVERIQNRKEKLDEAVVALENAKRSDKRVSQERMDRLQANVDNAATANAEALYQFGSKALDMSRDDARYATEVALKRAQIAASNRKSFEERMVEQLGKGDLAAGYKALKALDAKPADLMGEFNDFLKANPTLAVGDQDAAMQAFMRTKMQLGGLGRTRAVTPPAGASVAQFPSP